MSELHYGVNVENLLHELSQYESEDIGEFDVYGEDESGREGAATIDITLLASDAFSLIAELKAQRDALAAENVVLKVSRQGVVSAFDDAMNEFGMARGETAADYPAPETPATDAYLKWARDSFVDEAIHALAASGAQSFGDCMAALNQVRAGEPS